MKSARLWRLFEQAVMLTSWTRTHLIYHLGWDLVIHTLTLVTNHHCLFLFHHHLQIKEPPIKIVLIIIFKNKNLQTDLQHS